MKCIYLFYSFIVSYFSSSLLLVHGQMNCDGFECPSETTRCVMFDETTIDLIYIRKMRSCFDRTGKACTWCEL